MTMIKIPDFDPNSAPKPTTPESLAKAEAWIAKHRQKAEEQDATTHERIIAPPPPTRKRATRTVAKTKP